MHDAITMDAVQRTDGPPALQFAHILHPVSPEEFLGEYWGRRPLHIRGTPEKFAMLLDHKAFVRASARVDALQAYMANKDRTGHAAIVGIRPRQIKALYAGGFTICAKGLEKGSPSLAALARQVKSELHFTGIIDFRGYLSGHGSGAPVHFDARHATTMQIEGEKIWRFSAGPSMPFPPRNATVEGKSVDYVKVDPMPRVRDLDLEPALAAPPPDVELKEVRLRPGDVLYLPPGTWHSAQAVGHSLAVNMAFNYTKQGTAIELLTDLLYTLLYADPKWRATPPPFVGEAPDGKTPECVRRFLAERIDEARRVFADLDPSDPRIETVWRRRIHAE